MRTVNGAGTPFYLTGGTALSRFYFRHRYSDDLDYFVNSDPDFPESLKRLMLDFERGEKRGEWTIDRARLRKERDFARVTLVHPADMEVSLKLDFVNDLPLRFGAFMETEFGKIDSWENILSNKLAALFRFEPKDVADIWMISKNKPFEWRELFSQAKQKENSVDPVEAARIISTFPSEMTEIIKWAIPLETEKFLGELKDIGRDMLNGVKNTLAG
jgi:predicted nucleotidyltransferase component of viral defense system